MSKHTKSGQPQASGSKKDARHGPRRRTGGEAAADAIVRVAERFGWPGAALIIAWRFLETNGSVDQKRQVIDMFILGKGIGANYPFLVMAGVFALLLLAQRVAWKKRTKYLTDEIDRLSKWKSEHQESTIPGLHSSERH